MIPYGHQSISQEEIDALSDVLKSDWLTQGPKIPEFEHALAGYCGSQYAIACANGTAALHIACLAAGVGAGDIVWTSTISFVASANCARYCGAEVDFVDIDSTTRNISVSALKAKLFAASNNNCLPKVLVVVHFAGLPCDLDAIESLSREYGFQIIEDAAHALGSEYKYKKIGACTSSLMTTLSFHPVKTITTAEGGAVLTNNEEIAHKLRCFASHGINRDSRDFSDPQFKDKMWYYEQQTLGFNYRLSDLHAALGLVQLRKLESFIQKREILFDRYCEKLSDISILKLPITTRLNGHRTAWHLFVIELENQELRERVYQILRDKEVGVNVHYFPIHLQPYYRALGFKKGDFPEAEDYAAKALTLPLYPALTYEQQDLVISYLFEALG